MRGEVGGVVGRRVGGDCLLAGVVGAPKVEVGVGHGGLQSPHPSPLPMGEGDPKGRVREN